LSIIICSYQERFMTQPAQPQTTTTRVVLASRPQGRPTPANFRIEQQALPEIQANEVLLKTLYLSLDPYMRSRMDDAKSYAAPTQVGAVMGGGTVAQVVASRHAGYAEGDIVLAYSGWQSHAISNGKDLRKLDSTRAPVSTALGVLGMPGFTAYSGLLTIGQPKAGETVVVAAASGPVGATVGQIAKIKGARTVGIAGGAEKCALLIEKFGFDVAIDHRAADFPEQLAKACPDGIDVYFENVGGAVWTAVFPLLNTFARVPVCGLIAQYSGVGTIGDGADRLPKLMREILTRRLTIRGFINSDFNEQHAAFQEEMTQWLATGRIAYQEDVVDGLERAPEAFIGLLEGTNFGKLVIKVAEQNP
jgi:NADPH-dependent curcumin reductase CurA